MVDFVPKLLEFDEVVKFSHVGDVLNWDDFVGVSDLHDSNAVDGLDPDLKWLKVLFIDFLCAASCHIIGLFVYEIFIINNYSEDFRF